MSTESASSTEKTRTSAAMWLGAGAAIAAIGGSLITYVVSPIYQISSQMRELQLKSQEIERVNATQESALQSLQSAQREAGDKLARIETKLDLLLEERGRKAGQ